VKLQLVSAGAAQALVQRVAAACGLEAQGSFGAVGAMLEKFLAGEACDVVILSDAQIAKLAVEGRVDAGTCADLGSVATSIAVRIGDKVPPVGDEKALRSALLAASAIYFPDPAKATAGIHFAKVLDRLKIRDKVSDRVRTFPNGATAMRAMAEDTGHPVGCTQATEILATRGVRLVAPLPRGFDLDTVYTAAVSAGVVSPAARDFVAALCGDDARGDRVAAGFEGYVIRPATSLDAAAVREDVLASLLPHAETPAPDAANGGAPRAWQPSAPVIDAARGVVAADVGDDGVSRLAFYDAVLAFAGRNHVFLTRPEAPSRVASPHNRPTEQRQRRRHEHQ